MIINFEKGNCYSKAQIDALLEGYVADAEYVSSATTIVFYNGDGDTIATIDATDFIKDGMVNTVSVENGYLVITFNTDSGKQPISIPLSDLFDSTNYYTKAETDAVVSDAVSGKADASRVEVVEEVTSRALNTLNDSKQDTLVSGTNIKTVNGNSILGSGDIEIGGSEYLAGTGITIDTGNTISVDGFNGLITGGSISCDASTSSLNVSMSLTNRNNYGYLSTATIPNATNERPGAMSAGDKKFIDVQKDVLQKYQTYTISDSSTDNSSYLDCITNQATQASTRIQLQRDNNSNYFCDISWYATSTSWKIDTVTLMYQPYYTSTDTYVSSGTTLPVKIVLNNTQSQDYQPSLQFNHRNFRLIFANVGDFMEPQWLMTVVEYGATTYQLPINGSYKSAVAGTGVTNIIALSQTEYDNLATKDANTLYIIK